MKKYMLSLLGLSLLVIVGCCKVKTETMDDHSMSGMAAMNAKMVDGERLIYYTCPMESHKQVHSTEPGQCPDCGMTLVAGVITTTAEMDYYGCPMPEHSHVRSDQPGTCAECGMQLKPMRMVRG